MVTDLDDDILEFLIPFADTGVTDLKMYRYHDEEVEALTELTELPEEATDGTFFFDKEEKVIRVYASKFSLYSATYTASANPETSDNIGGYVLILLISAIGVSSVVFRKKDLTKI